MWALEIRRTKGVRRRIRDRIITPRMERRSKTSRKSGLDAISASKLKHPRVAPLQRRELRAKAWVARQGRREVERAFNRTHRLVPRPGRMPEVVSRDSQSEISTHDGDTIRNEFGPSASAFLGTLPSATRQPPARVCTNCRGLVRDLTEHYRRPPDRVPDPLRRGMWRFRFADPERFDRDFGPFGWTCTQVRGAGPSLMVGTPIARTRPREGRLEHGVNCGGTFNSSGTCSNRACPGF